MLLFITAYLSFYNLEGSLLWKDEAHTAFVAKNILEYGLPKVWDGKNLMTGTEGNDFNQSLVLINKGWMQFYITAGSFLILGVNTFAARFPFALLGFLSILLNYMLARKIFKKRCYAMLTLFYNIVCVQYILYIRTCRDYAATMFFISITTYLLFTGFDRENRISNNRGMEIILTVCMIISVSGIFYSNHLLGGVYCFTLVCYTVIFNWLFIKKALVIVIGGVLLWLPWLLYTWQSGVPSAYSISNSIIERFLIGIWKVQTYYFPFITVMSLLFFMYLLPIKKRHCISIPKEINFFFILVFVNIAAVSFVEFFVVNHYYLAVAVATPFLMTFVTIVVWEHSRFLTVPFVILLSFTNILNIVPLTLFKEQNIVENADAKTYGSASSQPTCLGLIASPFTEGDGSIRSLQEYLNDLTVECYLADMLHEIKNGYDGINREVVNLLYEHGNENDIVLYAGAESEPFVFYTNMKFIRTLSEEVNTFEEYFDEYPNKKFSYLVEANDEDIDWIILSSYGRGLLLDNSGYLKENLGEFKIYKTESVDLFLSNCSDLDYHKFRSDMEGDKVLIFQKK